MVPDRANTNLFLGALGERDEDRPLLAMCRLLDFLGKLSHELLEALEERVGRVEAGPEAVHPIVHSFERPVKESSVTRRQRRSPRQ